ncbi:hypothetical protein XENOCAPTIV_027333 [Xenoophorus captivus]|uniref:Uncharacterized protein n=1 Tax=Xenoophorus captivus TaxID=1517983 RepID=A0ABV0QNC5_9TELE
MLYFQILSRLRLSQLLMDLFLPHLVLPLACLKTALYEQWLTLLEEDDTELWTTVVSTLPHDSAGHKMDHNRRVSRGKIYLFIGLMSCCHFLSYDIWGFH